MRGDLAGFPGWRWVTLMGMWGWEERDWGREGRSGSGRSTGHGTPWGQALEMTRQQAPSTEPGTVPQ